MGFKDFWVVSDEKADEPKKDVPKAPSPTKTAFPSETKVDSQSTSAFGFGNAPTPSFTAQPTSGEASAEHLAKSIEVYRAGFESLNQPGYDFYEFYQAMMVGGADNAPMYSMALAMAKSMDKTITKDKLIQQSEYYITEINKSYDSYVAAGNAKKQALIDSKNHENQALVSELELMQQQMEQLKVQIQDRQTKLQSIGSKHDPKLSEIDSKLAANDIAKNQLIQSIEQVKQGIFNNIK